MKSIINNMLYKLLMMKRVKAFSNYMQDGMSMHDAMKEVDAKYPVSEKYLEYEKKLKEKETYPCYQ